MEELKVIDKSKDIAILDPAVLDPIVMREKTTTRLVFKPRLTNNEVDPKKPLLGTFAYQKKGRKDEWEDAKAINLSTLKTGDGVKLDISTTELHRLKEWFDKLYETYSSRGRLPLRHETIRLDPTPTPAWMFDMEGITQAETVADPELSGIVKRAIIEGRGAEVAKALALFLATPHAVKLAESLSRLDVDSVEKVNTLSGVARLKSALERWRANRDNEAEGFWQETLREDCFVLSQIFSFPVIAFEDEAFLGGKATNRKGDKLVDFLLKSKLTNNVLLVEIKTPETLLLGSPYRDVFKPSQALVGPVAQVTNYKRTLLIDYTKNINNSRRYGTPDEHYEAFDPRCLVIAGDTAEFGGDLWKRKGFDLYRNGLRNVDVITFDELFDKTQTLIDLLEKGIPEVDEA